MITEALIHGVALIARVAFFILAGLSMYRCIRAKGSSFVALVLALLSVVCLVSSSILATSGKGAFELLLFVLLEFVAALSVQRFCGKNRGNAFIVPPVVVLLALGGVLAIDTVSSCASTLKNLVVGIAVAAVVMMLVKRKGFGFLASRFVGIYVAALFLLILPSVPFLGQEIGGARNWIQLAGVTIQPSEFAKILMVIALAGYCSAYGLSLTSGPMRRAIVPFLFGSATALFVVIVQKDLGAAVVMLAVLAVVLAASSGKRGWIYIGALVLVVALLALFACLAFPYVRARFDVWLSPYSDLQGAGYQHYRAILALANGGILGTGLGFGQLYELVPVVESDYVLCVLGEELGIAGIAVAIMGYVAFAISGVRTARTYKRRSFEANAALGFASLIPIGALLNLGGVLGLLPMTGVVLPFLSQGGSSLVASLSGVVLLVVLSLHRTGVREPEHTKVSAGLGLLLPAALSVCLVTAVCLMAEWGGLRVFGIADRAVQKGLISTSDGIVLAQEEDSIRVYPQGSLASHVVGAVDGVEGFEQAGEFANALSGTDEGGVAEVFGNALALTRQGHDVVLSIDADVQLAAESALDGLDGACVVMDPTNGKILALASSDPMDLSDMSSGGTYLNRATQSLYAPGSTFKLVTLAAVLQKDVAESSDCFDAPATMVVGGGLVSNDSYVDYGNVSLTEATNLSANTVFAQLGQQVGSEGVTSQAEAFGFNENVECNLPLATSVVGSPASEWESAWMAIGQPVSENGPYATVLQMALVMAAIANDGAMVAPTIDDSADSYALGRALDSDTASTIVDILRDGEVISVDGGCVYGKTGTAQRAKKQDDAWFVGMGERDDGSRFVVALVVEEAGYGSEAARPRAADVLAAALK